MKGGTVGYYFFIYPILGFQRFKVTAADKFLDLKQYECEALVYWK